MCTFFYSCYNDTTYHIVGRRVYSIDRHYSDVEKEDLELNFFSLSIIAKATNNFSVDNKLGEGGFGPVYKVTSCIYVYDFFKNKFNHIPEHI